MQPTPPLQAKPEPVYCPLTRRLLAMLYDAVILLGLLLLASATALPFGDVHKLALRDFWFTLWLLAVCFVYLGACWRYGGMTVGMRAWKIKLVSGTDKFISWPRCLLRFSIAAISLAAFGLGIFWSIFDLKNRSWHDLAAATVLIKQTDAKQNLQPSSK